MEEGEGMYEVHEIWGEIKPYVMCTFSLFLKVHNCKEGESL